MTVYLVGAGPGDPGLLTVRAVELIARADVILYDRLIPPQALAHARDQAELIYVGKSEGEAPVPQEEIGRRLVEHGQAGRTVVRLKGGDPFVFGRGGEEAQALAEAAIDFEVVPGVTAGVAAPAYAGIPVTQRELSSAVAFLTGHEDPAKPESSLDWTALAAFPGTLVLYMGVGRLEAILERLRAAGRDPGEPAAVVERGTTADQRVVTGTISTLAGLAAEAEIRPPALAIVGPVATLREQLAWFERRPLAGRSVAITRARAQASGLAARLSDLGARVIEAPSIRIIPREGPVPELERYDLVCLTSANGVRFLFERMSAAGLDARALARTTVAAIGPGTAAALHDHGITADIVPERFVAEALVEALEGVQAGRALVARAANAREVLPDALRARGMDVDELALYEAVAERLTPDQLGAVAEADYLLFTSSSTVRFFLEAAGDEPPTRARIVSIGPVTSQTLREHGLEPEVEAERHDLDGLLSALLADAAT